MHALKAQVKNGRIVVDEATDLPEGKQVSLVLVEDDSLGDQEREAIFAMIDESFEDEAAGHVESFSALIEELRSQL